MVCDAEGSVAGTVSSVVTTGGGAAVTCVPGVFCSRTAAGKAGRFACASTSSATADSSFFTAAASFTRPNNTTAYAAGQRIANATTSAAVLEFTNVMRNENEAVRIEKVRMRSKLISVEDIPGGAQIATELTFEREGGDKPVCVAEAVMRRYA